MTAWATAGAWTTAPTVRERGMRVEISQWAIKLQLVSFPGYECHCQNILALSEIHFPPHCLIATNSWVTMDMRLMLHVCLSMVFSGVKCPFPGSVAKGRVTPILTEYLYRDYIFVRCDQGYKLMMVRWNLQCLILVHLSLWANIGLIFYQFPSFLCQDGQEMESFSTMCQSNGQWHLRLPECHSMLPLSSKNYKMNENFIVIQPQIKSFW